jgi:hypothetical protein
MPYSACSKLTALPGRGGLDRQSGYAYLCHQGQPGNEAEGDYPTWQDVRPTFFYFEQLSQADYLLSSTSLEINHTSKDIVKKSQVGAGVAVKIEHAVYESAKLFGRHFTEQDLLVSHLSRFVSPLRCDRILR